MNLHVGVYAVVHEWNAKANYRSQFFSPSMWVLGFKLLLDHNAFKNCLFNLIL